MTPCDRPDPETVACETVSDACKRMGRLWRPLFVVCCFPAD